MTTHSCTDSDGIPSQPAVRSAWDAVKSELTQFSVWTTLLGADVLSTAVNVYQGHIDAMVFGIAGGVGFGILTIVKAKSTIGILKGIPAPRL